MQAIVRDASDPAVSTDLDLVREENLITGIPSLAKQLGTLTSLEEDLLTLGASIFALDLAAKRGQRENIVRDLRLVVPVINHTAFVHLAEDLSNILYVLSHDNWNIEFVRHPGTPESMRDWPKSTGKTLLFSGGLDSLAGAVEELEQGTDLLLASHYTGNPITRGSQKRLYTYLEERFEGRVSHVSVKVTGSNRPSYGFPVDDEREPTQRTRSFLFLVIGAIAARRRGHHDVLMIAENGQMAIHLPLTASRIGAFSTHTAHPEFVDAMQRFLSALLSFPMTLSNPFLYRTKAECVTRLVEVHAEAIPQSVSCWRSSRQSHSHCGICIPCLIRRIGLEYHGLLLSEYQRDLLVEDITALPNDDIGKRNFSELAEFIERFGGAYSDAEILETFPDLYSEYFDKNQAIAMYRRFAGEARHVFARYPRALAILS